MKNSDNYLPNENKFNAMIKEFPEVIKTLLDEILESTHDMVFLVDPINFSIIKSNSKGKSLLPDTKKNNQTPGFVDLINPALIQDLEISIKEYLQTPDSRVALNMISEFKDTSGNSVPVNLNIKPLHLAQSSFLIITAQAALEEKYLSSEMEETHYIYQKVIENISGVPYLRNMNNNRFTYISNKCKDLLGIPAEEMSLSCLKKMVQEQIILTDNKPSSHEDYVKEFRQGLRQYYQSEMRIITPTGEEKWIRDHAVLNINPSNQQPLETLGILQDITATKIIENKLRTIKEIYTQAIKSARGVPYQFEYASERYTFVGDNAKEILGIPAEKLTLGNLNQYIEQRIYPPPVPAEKFKTLFITKRLDKYEADLLIHTPSGKKFWIHDSCVPMKDPITDEVIGTMGIFQDITAQKRTEQILKSQHLLAEKLILSMTPYEVGKILAEVLYDIFHYDAFALNQVYKEDLSKLKGIYYQDILDGNNNPTEVPANQIRAMSPLFKQVSEGKPLIINRQKLDNPDPKIEPFGNIQKRAFSLMYAPIRRGKDIWGLVTIQSYTIDYFNEDDLTLFQSFADQCSGALLRLKAEQSLQESEKYYRLLTVNSSDIIGRISMDGIIQYISPCAEQILGRPTEEYIGHGIYEYIHPDDLELSHDISRQVRAEKDLVIYKTRFRHKDGHYLWLETSARKVISPDQLEEIQFSARDITERIVLENQLIQSKRMELIGKLAGGIAHDFNNILTSIIGNTDILLTLDTLDSFVRESLEEINISANRGASLTQQLLIYARKKHTETILYQGSLVIENTLVLVRPNLGKNISIEYQDMTREDTIYADPMHIQEAFINIILNARDSMPQGGTIQIRTSNEDFIESNQNQPVLIPYWVVDITDTGIGIPEDILPHIFEPFYSTKDIGHGTGLGLSVAESIIRAHHGWITVTSKQAIGSSFHIYIPLNKYTENSSES